MKRLSVILLSLVFSMAAHANDDRNFAFYVGGGLQLSDGGAGFKLNSGMKAFKYVGLELGYGDMGSNVEPVLEYSLLGLLPVNDTTEFFLKLGGFSEQDSDKEDDSGTLWGVGIRIGDNSKGFVVERTMYESFDVYSLGFEKKF